MFGVMAGFDFIEDFITTNIAGLIYGSNIVYICLLPVAPVRSGRCEIVYPVFRVG